MRDFPGDPPYDAPLPVRAKRKFRVRDEDRLQIACVRWLRSQPHLRFLVAQPERLNPLPHRRDFLRALGILGNSGAPELIVLDERDGGVCWWIELKSGKGRMSAEQKGWRLWLEVSGFRCAVVRSVDELVALIG